MRLVCIMLCLWLLSSCSIFKRSTKQEKKLTIAKETELQEKELMQFNKESRRVGISYAADSANHAYQVEIIPKGLFNFSVDSGFRGEALSLKVQGNLREQKQQLNLSVQSEKNAKAAYKQTKVKHQDNISEMETQKDQRFRTGWVIFGGLLVLVLIGFLYRKFQ